MLIQALKSAQHVLLVCHRGPDGDTTGSALGLAHYFKSLNIRYTIFCLDTVPEYLSFLPGSSTIGPHENVWKDSSVDLIIVLDTSDPRHAGISDHLKKTATIPVVVIDHHITNQLYGDYNIVDAAASSTCEIVYRLLKSEHAITKTIATCLLTGIITDTGSFSNLATTPSAIQAAADLLSYGANLQEIARHTLNYRPLTTLKLWGRALERLHEDKTTGMVVTYITLDDIKECEADHTAASGISNFLNELDQAATKAVMVLIQTEPGIIKGSLRTTSPLIDVSEFAKLYGGGGHKKAAGFITKGTLIPTTTGYTINHHTS